VKPNIRKATRADIPRISEIRQAVRENRLTTESPQAVAATATAEWLIERSAVLVWEEDGHIQGFSAADPRDGSIFALFVDPAHEGQGIARALLPQACDMLLDAGYRTATLTTDAGTRAERFYRRDGWVETGRKKDGQIVFRKSL
jgi:GNAT superfamily N-acetyltransferase